MALVADVAAGDEGDWACKLALLKEMASGMPALDAISFFDGTGSMSSALRACHLRTASYDILNDTTNVHNLQDIATEAGLQVALVNCARLRAGGLAWMAPPCSNWVWVSASKHRRSIAQPLGDDWCNSKTFHHNQIIRAVSIVARACSSWRVHWVIENPLSSCMFQFPELKAVILSSNAKEASMRLSTFGSESAKPVRLVGTAPWLPRLGYMAAVLPRQTPRRVLAWRDEAGRATGIPGPMEQSAAYPAQFSTTVAKLQADMVLSRNNKFLAITTLARRFLHCQHWAVQALLEFL